MQAHKRYTKKIKSNTAAYFQTVRSKAVVAELFRLLIVTHLFFRHPKRLLDIFFESTVIYTAITGRYDPLSKSKRQLIQSDYIAFTDVKTTSQTRRGWRCIQEITSDSSLSDRLKAKLYKVCPSRVNELSGYDNMIWIDGSMRVNSIFFSLYVLLQTDTLGLLPHPDRSSIADEVKYCCKMKKYAGISEKILACGNEWSKRVKRDNQLFACGLIVYRDRLPSLESLWWSSCVECEKDQISFPYVIDKLEVSVSKLSRNLVRYGFVLINHEHRVNEYDLVT